MTPKHLLASFGPREAMAYDVVIVGAGLAGLSTAIRLKQLDPDTSVIVLEKGSEPGAHVLSGAILDPRALNELFPDWKARAAPLDQPVTGDDILMLSAMGSRRIPDVLVTRNFHNRGCYIVRLGHVVKWLADEAEALGVEIFPGFAGAELLFGEDGSVRGVATGHVGLGKDGDPKDSFQLGMELTGRYTIFAEGARGHLARQLLERLRLTEDRDPQGYAIGIKELWEVPPGKARPGRVVHTTGWPMGREVFGGGFLYHLQENLVALGLVVGLDYANPWLSPFDEMQRWKTHPAIRAHTEGGKRLSYGARAINNGMPQALPKIVFPGGALVGCAAGFMNAARIKGSHAAIKSGMLCAEALAEALAAGRSGDELSAYPELYARSWLAEELQQSRNFKLWFKKRPKLGPVMTGVEHWLLPKIGVNSPPWTLRNDKHDHASLKPAAECAPIAYPKPDGALTFDRLSSVFLGNVNHEEDQPPHLTLKDPSIPIAVNLARYGGPEQRYCPAGVYEFVKGEEGDERLLINAQNCIHCKTCDIKDPTQNIVWTAPEGGGGPNYAGM